MTGIDDSSATLGQEKQAHLVSRLPACCSCATLLLPEQHEGNVIVFAIECGCGWPRTAVREKTSLCSGGLAAEVLHSGLMLYSMSTTSLQVLVSLKL